MNDDFIYKNKIYCDDFLKVTNKLPKNIVDLIISDPPFGCNASMKGDYIDDEDYIKQFIPKWLERFAYLLKPGCHIYLFIPTKYLENWIIHFKKLFKFNNIIVCENMKRGRNYTNNFRHNYQMILFGSKGRAKKFNHIRWILTSDGWFNDKRNKNPQRYTYSYPAFLPPYLKATVEERTGTHPDEKNAILISNLIKKSSNIGDLVLDGFCGGGVVPAESKKIGRYYLACEINKIYYDETIERVDKIPIQKFIDNFL